MSRIKTLIAGFLLSFGVCAYAAEPDELTEIIATCAGRMSAELEFAWLLSDPQAEIFEEQRLRFVEILETLAPVTNPEHRLGLRIDAKMAHASLLTNAYFGTNAARAAWAKRHAITQRNHCQNMLLDS
ncbi:MAG: hypothetical protein AAF641_08295 [Pseudomonadota bacterium]